MDSDEVGLLGTGCERASLSLPDFPRVRCFGVLFLLNGVVVPKFGDPCVLCPLLNVNVGVSVCVPEETFCFFFMGVVSIWNLASPSIFFVSFFFPSYQPLIRVTPLTVQSSRVF